MYQPDNLLVSLPRLLGAHKKLGYEANDLRGTQCMGNYSIQLQTPYTKSIATHYLIQNHGNSQLMCVTDTWEWNPTPGRKPCKVSMALPLGTCGLVVLYQTEHNDVGKHSQAWERYADFMLLPCA